MKKTIIAVILALGFIQGAAASVCPSYEYAELQTLSDEELGEIDLQIMRSWANLNSGSSIAGAAEYNNCQTQADRLTRITKARIAAKARLPK